MKKIQLLIVELLFFCSILAQNKLINFVNPMVGTGGHGHTFPGVCMPFGMVQLSPDTRIDGSWDGCSGYHFSDSIIYGFSHTHLSGTGCSDYGDIAFLPSYINNENKTSNFINGVKFNHTNETAKIGYYSVKLENDIKVELTASTRAGFQKYTFLKNGKACIILNLKHRDFLIDGKINKINNTTFSGYRRSKAWAKDQLLFYHFQINKQPEDIEIIEENGKQTQLFLYYTVKVNDEILMKTAISSTNENGAEKNLKTEIWHWDFNGVMYNNEGAWEAHLNKIKVEGGTEEQKKIFYTALYHCMIHPSVMSDVDSNYRGRDNLIHHANWGHYYTVFSLWDTYRALHPLLNLIDKKVSYSFIKTFQAQFEHNGRLPMWELWGNETDCMIGMHSIPVILDAYNKHVISEKDLIEIYPAILAELNSKRFSLPIFKEKGYLEVGDEPESVSKTVEYSFDFACAEKIALILNDTINQKIFNRLSMGAINLYNPNSGFFQPVKNAQWLSNFDPFQINNHYTEGNAWHYSILQNNPNNLFPDIDLTDTIFNVSNKTTGREQADVSGLIGQYAHGNEPSHHIPYLLIQNNPKKGAQIIQFICDSFYKNTPDGLIGNEDCGQMSAWYVFSAMGFYPANPFDTNFILGNMIFDNVYLERAHICKNPLINCKEHYFPERPYKSNKLISISELQSYKHIFFSISGIKFYNKIQNKIDYYSSTIKTPKLKLTNNNLIAFENFPIQTTKKNLSIFEKNLDVFISKNNNPFMGIKYNPKDTFKESICYFTYAILDSSLKKNVIENPLFYSTYIKPNNNLKNYSIQLKSIPLISYREKGDSTLIDYDTGNIQWRSGNWLGFQAQNVEVIIDLKQKKKIKKIGMGFLQDVGSWIVFPKELQLYSSNDGINYKLISTVTNPISDSTTNSIRKIFSYNNRKKIKTRYLKLVAVQYGKLPDWHLGKGENSIIFTDEIYIE